jgi:hypothetical protein
MTGILYSVPCQIFQIVIVFCFNWRSIILPFTSVIVKDWNAIIIALCFVMMFNDVRICLTAGDGVTFGEQLKSVCVYDRKQN